MEITRVLKELWIRRHGVAAGAAFAGLVALYSVFSIGIFPPSLESRSHEFATARTQVLVDTPRSTVGDLTADLQPLVLRAGVYSRLLVSPAAIQIIGKAAGINPAELSAQGPFELNQPRIEQEPTAERRGSQLLSESNVYRLRFESNSQLPIVTIFAQAPTQMEATRLANGSADGLEQYVRRLQIQQHTPIERQVSIRRLGTARGGVVNEGADIQIAMLVFIAVLGGWCLLLLPAANVARGWANRELDGAGTNGHDPFRDSRIALREFDKV
jgi:hypothetical protein